MWNNVFVFLPVLLLYSMLVVWAERKISAFIQDRYGPTVTGKYGLLQTIADLVKMLQKEDIVPGAAHSFLFKAAPFLIFISVFVGFSVVPISLLWSGMPIQNSLLFLISVLSLDVIGIFVAGWSSGNKYGMLGAVRAGIQLFSYEIPLGLCVLCVVIFSGSLDLWTISLQQEGHLFHANIFQHLFLVPVWLIFFICTLAESNRTPFDIAEADGELIAGFQIEYSGIRWALVMLGEYGLMFLLSILGTLLFWGAFHSPLPNVGTVRLYDWTTGQSEWAVHAWGLFWLMSKSMVFVFLQIVVRWTFPRLRLDQVVSLCWKYLTPIALLLAIGIAATKLV